MVKIGNSTYKFNYTFLKNYAKGLLDIDLDRGEPPAGAYALVADDGRFLAAYDGVSWVAPDEDGYDHLNLTVVWTKTFRDALALGDLIVKSEKFKLLGLGMRFAIFRIDVEGKDRVLVQLREFKKKPEEPKPEPPPTAVGEQRQDNAVPGPDIPENHKDDEEVPQ